MEPYQTRVVQEQADLSTKVEKLHAFLNSDSFKLVDTDEQGRMKRQYQFMSGYLEVLNERIAAFHKE